MILVHLLKSLHDHSGKSQPGHCKSHLMLALYLSISGNIVDCHPLVNSFVIHIVCRYCIGYIPACIDKISEIFSIPTWKNLNNTTGNSPVLLD